MMYRKVLLYIGALQLGGAERVLSNLGNALVEIGKEVILVNDILPVPKMKEYSLNNEIKRIFLDERDKKVNNISRIIRLRKILRKEKPDVAISFLGPPNIRLLISSRGLKLKSIVSVRNDPYFEYGHGIVKFCVKRLFNCSDGCVFQTEEASKYFSRKTRNKSQIIYNPVNSVFFEQKLTTEKKIVVVIGRLQKQKNPWLPIKAWALIKDEFPDYKLQFYGEGELKDELITLSKELGVYSKVEFLGQVDNISEILACASVFVLSSDYEGMPNALMEAMAIGVPSISTDCPCGGPATLIQDESQGILVPVNKEDELASKISTLLKDEKLRKKMRVAAKLRAIEFQPQKVFEQWDTYIGRVCDRI